LFKGLTYTFTILFLLLLVILSFHARFAADDYYFIFLEKSYGAIGGTVFQYGDFSGRWLCHFISLTILKLSGFKYFLPAFFLLTLGTLYLILSSLFYKIYNWYDVDEQDFNSDFPPLLIIASLVLCSFSVGENWFWFISVTTYVWSLIFGLILVNLYLNNKYRFYTPILLIFSSLYIGSASESFAVLTLLFSILFVTFKMRSEGIEAFKANPKNRTLLFMMILIFASFLLSTLSPGTFNRNDLLPTLSIWQKSEILIRSLGKVIIQYLPSKIHLFLILGIPWLAFGFYIQEMSQYKTKAIIRNISLTILLTGMAILVSLFPTVFILGEIGPARALLIITLIFTLSFAFLFTLTGMLFNRESHTIKITSFAFFFSIIYLFYQNIYQYRVTKVFSETYDERIRRIDELKKMNFTGIAELSPLPASGMNYHAELSTDTSFFVNQHWKKGLQLKYNVVLAR
jgi:hypothetical protein